MCLKSNSFQSRIISHPAGIPLEWGGLPQIEFQAVSQPVRDAADSVLKTTRPGVADVYLSLPDSQEYFGSLVRTEVTSGGAEKVLTRRGNKECPGKLEFFYAFI